MNHSHFAPSSSLVFSLLLLVLAGCGTDMERGSWSETRKIIGQYDLESVGEATPEPIRKLAHTAARMEFSQTLYGFCTATRVSETLFLTSAHCMQNCADVQFTMGYELNIAKADRAIFKCEHLVASSQHLDYALYQAKRPTDENYPKASLAATAPYEGQAAHFPSHPLGRFLEIDLSKDCSVLAAAITIDASGRHVIKHQCDAEGGSSGGPIFDAATGTAIALHAGGRDREYNVAIPMHMIVADLAKKLLPEEFASLSIAQLAP